MDAFYYGCAGFAAFAISDEAAALAVAMGVSVNTYLAGAGVIGGVAIGAGFSATAEIVSFTLGFQLTEGINFQLKFYYGIGASFGFMNGFTVGGGLGWGLEFSFITDLYALAS